MGCDFNSVCHDCEEWQSAGFGSYGSWITGCATVEEFDAKAAERPGDANLDKNKNIRHFLVQHAGHRVEQRSGDSYSWDDADSPKWAYLEIEHRYHMGCGCPNAGRLNALADAEDYLAAHPEASQQEVAGFLIVDGRWSDPEIPRAVVAALFIKRGAE